MCIGSEPPEWDKILGYRSYYPWSLSNTRCRKRALDEGKNLVNLFSTDRREPFQELVYCRTLVEVLEQGSNRQARTSEAPGSAKLASLPVNSATSTPIHTVSLSLIA